MPWRPAAPGPGGGTAPAQSARPAPRPLQGPGAELARRGHLHGRPAHRRAGAQSPRPCPCGPRRLPTPGRTLASSCCSDAVPPSSSAVRGAARICGDLLLRTPLPLLVLRAVTGLRNQSSWGPGSPHLLSEGGLRLCARLLSKPITSTGSWNNQECHDL